jgi:hypothetical protein
LAVSAAGENIDRNGACKDTGKSVIVKTTDTCPCSYPNNYFSEWLACHPSAAILVCGQVQTCSQLPSACHAFEKQSLQCMLQPPTGSALQEEMIMRTPHSMLAKPLNEHLPLMQCKLSSGHLQYAGATWVTDSPSTGIAAICACWVTRLYHGTIQTEVKPCCCILHCVCPCRQQALVLR